MAQPVSLALTVKPISTTHVPVVPLLSLLLFTLQLYYIDHPQKLLFVMAGLYLPFQWTNNLLRKLRADICRLLRICESPTASLYTDTIDGVVMIRAFGLQEVYRESLITLKDQEAKVGVQNWFGGSFGLFCSYIGSVGCSPGRDGRRRLMK